MEETSVELDSWVNLPRLGTDVFKELMKTGVEYSTGRGFYIRSSADLPSVKRIISAVVGGEVYFVFRCFICGEPASCGDCRYKAICSVDHVGGRCVCAKCARKGFAAYSAKWTSSLDRPQ